MEEHLCAGGGRQRGLCINNFDSGCQFAGMALHCDGLKRL
ncbi:hypothetical protein HNE_2595 [Hyphomonas neptunium ATCC 15444]|uniref:Uncharacterized protein n=1 Tax=Hyphomonas neptunium (strain ATCC 15444) TaxID=228405 RepID=Q0BZ08_HYPNA|nr:hypothetical protein HNE_2595 [Hyphomonas neptunium ATCC 15444]